MKYSNFIFKALALIFLSQHHLRAQWVELGGSNNFANTWSSGKINTIAVGPQTNNIFVGGDFGNLNSGTREVSRYLSSTSSWTQAGNFSSNGEINTIAVTQYGALAGGSFNINSQNYIAQFTGTSWVQFGTIPKNGWIQKIITDQSGNIYAGVNGDSSCVIKLNGNNWEELGGLNSMSNILSASTKQIFSICTDPNNNIYACGSLYANTGMNRVVKFNGNNWSMLPDGSFDGPLYDICSDKFGNIYVAVNGQTKQYVAKFNGTNWTELGGNNALAANGSINTLFADKSGIVYAGGDFTNQSNKRYVAKFDGLIWSELGGANALAANGSINVITSDTLGNIIVGGNFKNTSGNTYVAKYNCQITKPIITANPGTFLCDGESIILTSSSLINNIWSTQETTQSIVVKNAGTYFVTVNSGGCSSTSDPVVITSANRPEVTMEDIPNCGFVNLRQSNIVLNGSPVGGVFYGPGVTGNSFNPKISGLGHSLIKYKFTDNNGCFNEAIKNIIVYDTLMINDTLIIRLNINSGMNDLTYNTIKVYPNPTSSYLVIDYGDFNLINNYTVIINNTNGQELYKTKVNNDKSIIDLSTWGGKGLYFINILDDKGTLIQTRKIILN